MGFALRIINAPAEAVLWNANFAENTFNYDPIADSGWLGIDETWEYPGDPLGCTTLRVWALDANNNILFDVRDLGPIYDGGDYVFDCSTLALPTTISDSFIPLIGLALLMGMVAMMVPAMKEGFS